MISYLSISALLLVIIFLIALIVIQHIHYFNHVKELQSHWQGERKELLDRIQSPTFHEFKSAEIRTIKANKQEEPQIPIILE